MRSDEYWAKRVTQRMLDIELMGNGYAQRIYGVYEEAYRQIARDMRELLDRYMKQGDLTPTEAAQYLRDPIGREQQNELLRRLNTIDDLAVKRRFVARINSASYRARQNRMEALKERIRIESARVAPNEIAINQEALRASGNEAYYRTIFDTQQQAELFTPIIPLSIRELDQVAAQRWVGPNYSARIWTNTNDMAEKLGEIIRVNVSTGRSWRKCMEEVKNYATDPGQGALFVAERLLRTETNRIANELSSKAYEDLGAQRYDYVSMLDLRTSDTCREHDGSIDPSTHKHYTYANKKVGENFPPLHPLCRSTTRASVDPELLKRMQRAARNPETGEIEIVPASWTYKKWYEEKVAGSPQAQINEKMIRNTAADRIQHAKYREALGNEIPKDLAEFQLIKYTDVDYWKQLKVAYSNYLK